MSQAVYREVHPPSAVTHAVDAYFTQPGPRGAGGPPPNLIVAKGTRLEVYSIRHGGPHTSAAGGEVHAASRLELVGAWPLWGTVEDMVVLSGRRAAGERDSLLLGFRCAKVSAVAWDDTTSDLRVTSLHSFEGSDTNLNEGRLLLQAPLLAADPLGRCAAVVVYGRHLAALQRYQLDDDEAGAQEGVKQQATPYPTLSNGYLIPAITKIGQVRHAVFLHGYTEPLLLLLHEPEPTWPGRYRERHDTCQLSGLSLNFKRSRYPLIWSVPNLPSDCCRLMAVPRGGVLVLSQSLIMYHTQGSSCVLAINSNAFAGEVPPRLELPQPPPSQQWGPVQSDPVVAARAATAAAGYASKWATHPHPDTAAAAAKAASTIHGMELEADGAIGTWLSSQVALVGLKTGQLVLVGLRFSGNTATRIQVVLAGASPILSCAATLTSSLVFLGSGNGDSLLVRFTPPGVAPNLSLLSGNPSLTSLASWKTSSSGSEPASKKPRLARLLSADMGGAEEGLLQRCRSGASSMSLGGWDPEDAYELYRSAMGRSNSFVGSTDAFKAADSMLDLELRVMDSLPSLGPLSDFCTTKLTLGAETGQGGVSHDVLIAATGSDKAGAVAVLRRGLVADVITMVPLEGIHGAWTLYYKPRAEVSGPEETDAAAAAAAAAREEGLGGQEDEDRHAFLLLSSKGVETLVLDARGEELATIAAEDTGFLTTAATLCVGEVLAAAAAVQVTPLVLRLVAGGHLLQEVHLQDLLQRIHHPAAAGGAGAALGAAAGAVASPGRVSIASASVRDPYVALHLSDGCALLLHVVAGTTTSSSSPATAAVAGDVFGEAAPHSGPSMRLVQAAVHPLTGVLHTAAADNEEEGTTAAAAAGAEVTAVCLCVDRSGWLTKATGGVPATPQQQQQQPATAGQGTAAGQGPASVIVAADTAAPAAAAAEVGQGVDAGAAQPSEPGPSAMEVEQQQEQQQEQPQTPAGEDTATAMQVDEQQQDETGSPVQQTTAAVAEAGGDAPVAEAPAAPAPGPAAAQEEQAPPAAALVGGAEIGSAVGAPHAAAPVEGVSSGPAVGAPHAATAAAAAAGLLAQMPSFTGGSGPFAAAAAEAVEAAAGTAGVPAEVVVYCCACFRGGRVALYRLPGMEVVWEEADALLRHEVLGPLRARGTAEEEEEEEDPEEAELVAATAMPFVEVLVEEWCDSSGGALGVPAAPVPHMVLVGDSGELTVYKPFTSLSGVLGFKRQAALDPLLLDHQEPAPPHPQHPRATPARRLYRFDGLITPHIPPWMLASHLGALEGIMSHRMPQLMSSGVFVAGARPLWLVASRGGLVAHPMHHEGVEKQSERSQKTSPVAGMCTFNNSNCPHGFILVAPTTDMHICQLPMEVRLDTPWLCHKMPLRAQPQALTWVPSPNLLALVVTRLGPYKPLLPIEDGSDPAAAAAYAAADAAAKVSGVQEHCELQLITPPGSPLLPPATTGPPKDKPRPPVTNGGWAYPKWTYPLLPGETGLCLQQVALREAGPGGPAGDPKPYLALGTSSTYGEDFPAAGRVLLFQLGTISSLRAEGGEEERLTARLELWQDMLNPVSALHSVGGYLLVAMGNLLELHFKQGNRLIKAAFFDVPLLTTSLCVLPSKGFILTGDMQYGASFVLYRERDTKRELVGLGSTPNRAAATAVEFLPNASKLSLLLADAGGSISLHVFDKNHPDSRVGQDLLRVAAAHTGAPLTRVMRVRMILPQQHGNRQSVLGATTAGGFQLIASCWDEAMFRRLRSLQEDLLYRVRHAAGLNPRAFRCRYSKAQPGVEGGLPRTRPLLPEDNGLLQGDLLWRYTALDLVSQVRVAEALGVTRGDILSDLAALARATAFV